MTKSLSLRKLKSEDTRVRISHSRHVQPPGLRSMEHASHLRRPASTLEDKSQDKRRRGWPAPATRASSSCALSSAQLDASPSRATTLPDGKPAAALACLQPSRAHCAPCTPDSLARPRTRARTPRFVRTPSGASAASGERFLPSSNETSARHR